MLELSWVPGQICLIVFLITYIFILDCLLGYLYQIPGVVLALVSKSVIQYSAVDLKRKCPGSDCISFFPPSSCFSGYMVSKFTQWLINSNFRLHQVSRAQSRPFAKTPGLMKTVDSKTLLFTALDYIVSVNACTVPQTRRCVDTFRFRHFLTLLFCTITNM